MLRSWLVPGSFQEPGHGFFSLRLGRSLALPVGPPFRGVRSFERERLRAGDVGEDAAG